MTSTDKNNLFKIFLKLKKEKARTLVKRPLSYGNGSSSLRERSTTVTSYYNQTEIDKAACQPSIRLTPATIMYTGTSHHGSQIMRSAQYLHRELPIRLAHQISGFRNLPFIVGCNPTILSVHEMYIGSFRTLNDFPRIKSVEDEEKYSQILKDLLDQHKDVVGLLAQGFKESKKHIKNDNLIQDYLDKNLTSRLGIRMLATHHLHLKANMDGNVGIINMNMNLKKVVERWTSFVADITKEKYGECPNVKISGHIHATFPYIEMPLDYILPEILKNAFRAVLESHLGLKSANIPAVYITIANNEKDFIIKLSDRGGGIPHDKIDNVMKYNFSTAEDSVDMPFHSTNVFDSFMDVVNRSTSGPMHGYGFGVPTSRAYAEYLGGSLKIESMQGLGTDVYLRLKHFNVKSDTKPFRI